ncbi:MAG: hypothetical protein WCC57_15675 [Paracoccaceae bacterium]
MSGNPDDRPQPTDPAQPRAQSRRGPGKALVASAREDRLKAALKANMARRKAQLKARAGVVDDNNKE